MDTPRNPKAILNKLGWVLSLTRLGLFAEQLIRAFWPVWSILFVGAAALMLGVQDSLWIEMAWALTLVGVASAVWFFVRGVTRFETPTRADALHRLDETLPGRPVRTLLDQPAMGQNDPATLALWEAHQARMAEKAAQARPPKPDLRVSALDPFGLRYIAVLAISVALLFGSVTRIGSVTELSPGPVNTIAAASWEGWVEPPSYTGLPTIYLNDQPEGTLNLPINSRVILRLYGEIGALTVQETVSARVGDVPSAAEAAQDFVMRQDGDLIIAGDGGRQWDIALTPDALPQIVSIGEAEVSARGEMSVPFQARDDYEVIGGTAVVTLDLANVDRRFGLALEPESQSPIELQLPLPIAGSRSDYEETLIEDFSDNVWAHLPVKIEFQVSDAADQKSLVEQVQLNLPARSFFDPLARAIVEQRRDLLWNRDNAPRTAQLIRAISHNPEESLFRKDTDYLRLRMILRRLEAQMENGLSDENRDQLAADLWELALAIEEGDLSDALARMERAQERLQEAMRNGASDEEIERLMQELRQATDEYLRRLAEQNMAEGQQGQQGDQQQAQNQMTMNQDDIQRMMDRIQELMEQGRMAEAQQALEELNRMLQNMQVAQGGQGGQQSQGQQALEELGETLRNQQGLSDQAFRDLQEQFNPNSNAGESQGNEGRNGGQGRGQSHEGQGGQGQGDGSGETGEGGLEQSLADRQQALRQELNRQQQGLPGAGTPEGDAAREALGRAGDAMDGAEQALRENDLAEAIDRQSEAMDALREGIQNLGEAMAQNQQQGGQEGSNQAQAGSGQRDPLGRNPGTQGNVGSEENLLQGEDVYRRARDLLDEIRRRSGETDRSEKERNYLERLLDRF